MVKCAIITITKVAFALLVLGACDARSHRKLRMAPDEGHGIEGSFIVQVKKQPETNQDKSKSVRIESTKVSSPLSIFLDNIELKHAVIERSFDGGFHGFTVSNLVHDKDFDTLLNHDDVLLVEQDQRLYTFAHNTQNNPPWGVDRLDQDNTNLDAKYGYDFDGEGVKVFVMDTGIVSGHNDFSGRVTCGFNAQGGNNCNDEDGHGTHMAGRSLARTSISLCSGPCLDTNTHPLFRFSDRYDWRDGKGDCQEGSTHCGQGYKW